MPQAAVSIADTPLPVAKPSVLGDKARVQKDAASDLVPAAPPAPPGVRTLEDTVVDLLRPMVRDWLDDNMPRLVEKALRIEATDRARAQDDTKH
jgi:hypothetical protein